MTPAVVIAGTHSGCGKTTVARAVMAALARRGLTVQGFKVGPDFIDPGHHAAITGRPGRNLDTWMMGESAVLRAFARHSRGADIAVIEGVMGLFDGRGVTAEGSTAELAALLGAPVVLVVDARGMSRSIGAIVRGFRDFDPSIKLAGVIANRLGSDRHFAEYLLPQLHSRSGPEPLGYLRRDESLTIPERHLGLVTAGDFAGSRLHADRLADTAEATLDLDRLVAMAAPPGIEEDPKPALHASPGHPESEPDIPSPKGDPSLLRPRVAVARDDAFCFYYEDNLEALRDAGAEILPFSPLNDRALPEGTDLVYLGGGYPELNAARLAENLAMREALRQVHRDGGAIYAECGGMMACCRSLRTLDGREFPLWDLIPARAVMQDRFAALGYITARSRTACLLGPSGAEIRGHEFHYSRIEALAPLDYATDLHREGREPRADGIAVGGLLAGYAHLHFSPEVATHVVGRVSTRLFAP